MIILEKLCNKQTNERENTRRNVILITSHLDLIAKRFIFFAERLKSDSDEREN